MVSRGYQILRRPVSSNPVGLNVLNGKRDIFLDMAKLTASSYRLLLLHAWPKLVNPLKLRLSPKRLRPAKAFDSNFNLKSQQKWPNPWVSYLPSVLRS